MSYAPTSIIKIKPKDINRIIYLARLFNNNLAGSNILCFYRTNYKNDKFNSFKTNIQKNNFCHLVGIVPSKRFVNGVHECRLNRSPSNLIFDSIISGDKSFVRNIDFTHNAKLMKDKLKVGNSLFSFNKQENIVIEINNKDIVIKIKSDNFIYKENCILGFAFDDEKGIYYQETSLLFNNSKSFKNSYPIVCFIKNQNYMQYKFTMCNNSLSKEDRINILNEFIRSEKIDLSLINEINFVNNDIFSNQFKDLWNEIVKQKEVL